MVMLAEKKRQKLLLASNSQSSNTSDEEMDSKEEMQDWLLSVGIVSPLKKGVFRSFVSPIIVSTELISPEDLLQACSLWEKFDVYRSIMLQKFDSGVMAVQNKSCSDEEVFF
ncbi:vacuolar protein sorting-associated protein 36-like isoform X2 [Tripterygium wilfordii]|uniref:vacuolar protein sorting-associated protein 36-like isoform X2 n=1 Tax=Tripterygium wilfordii TaxID=458696 RepID=UPI0018F85180|nr:vacuolar protein sorting-associated protein 36-like isoform X2 [Tripterygium wilfordii]XP_038679765.1 vacuolar protein sorting-associated protein 36-like isoform X2 [Tripterygium wilfordii]XP_038679766.1 vacuolar protein sorting-associated protein 36-like isoform X2 [Tripterygium wilfordii]XP_038679767.1 vacuolar protein sorting-associated protein 36-like isoform X2 [Tripterygium wilfordii]